MRLQLNRMVLLSGLLAIGCKTTRPGESGVSTKDIGGPACDLTTKSCQGLAGPAGTTCKIKLHQFEHELAANRKGSLQLLGLALAHDLMKGNGEQANIETSLKALGLTVNDQSEVVLESGVTINDVLTKLEQAAVQHAKNFPAEYKNGGEALKLLGERRGSAAAMSSGPAFVGLTTYAALMAKAHSAAGNSEMALKFVAEAYRNAAVAAQFNEVQGTSETVMVSLQKSFQEASSKAKSASGGSAGEVNVSRAITNVHYAMGGYAAESQIAGKAEVTNEIVSLITSTSGDANLAIGTEVMVMAGVNEAAKNNNQKTNREASQYQRLVTGNGAIRGVQPNIDPIAFAEAVKQMGTLRVAQLDQQLGNPQRTFAGVLTTTNTLARTTIQRASPIVRKAIEGKGAESMVLERVGTETRNRLMMAR